MFDMVEILQVSPDGVAQFCAALGDLLAKPEAMEKLHSLVVGFALFGDSV